MYFCLYVCVPRDEARTSLQARRKVARYLEAEHFTRQGRFCGQCDYCGIGGNYSGRLILLRLRARNRKRFDGFWKRLNKGDLTPRQVARLFRESFKDFEGESPFERNDVPFYGLADDAQIIDQELYRELEDGFDEYVTHEYEITKPNAIFTDLGEGEWEPEIVVDRYWAVVVDYHD